MLKQVPRDTLITGWDFSTSGVKCLAFDLDGNTIAEVRLPTDLWTKDGVSELNIFQLEGQARGSVRTMANVLREKGRLNDWLAGGISEQAGQQLGLKIDANPVCRPHYRLLQILCGHGQHQFAACPQQLSYLSIL